MTSDGMWDLYGNFHAAFDDITWIDEAEVKRIVDKREAKIEAKKQAKLKVLQTKMQAELE